MLLSVANTYKLSIGSIMPGTEINQQNSTTSRNGSPVVSADLFAHTKDISEIKVQARRLNDYTTIPRRQSAPPRNRGNQSSLITHATRNVPPSAPPSASSSTPPSAPSSDNHKKQSGCQSKCAESVAEQKKDKTWSFRKLKNALKRSKSLKQEKTEVDSKHDSDSSCSGVSDSRVPVIGILSSPRSYRATLKDSTHGRQTLRCNVDSEDTYAAIDNLRSGYSIRDLTACIMCQSGQTESTGQDMAVTLPKYTPGYGRTGAEAPSQKSGVLKAMSSLAIRNSSSRKRGTRKPRQEAEHERGDFTRDTYRGSFKDDNCGRRLANIDCQRSKSFSSPTSEKPPVDIPFPKTHVRDHMEAMYTKQTEYETRDNEVLYSLAKADDQPPPLPERTYLKLREAAAKENVPCAETRQKSAAASIPLKSVAFTLQEQNNNYKPASYPSTIPMHVRLHSSKPHVIDHKAAKPFMLHSHLRQDMDQCTVSSGYSSESDYSHVPSGRPEKCALPKRSRHLSARKPSQDIPGLPGYYSNRATEESKHSEAPVKMRQKQRQPSPRGSEEEDVVEDPGPAANVIHNLPLPPGPGGAQLIRTLRLDSILKSKWISGIAVTKKNEYIVVDQREAYLLDEEGTLKKLIGSKGSNKLIEPFNVSVNPSNGNLVICDHAEQDVKIFTWKGQFLKRIKDPALNNIAGVAVTDSRDIVIAGTDKQRVSVLNEDGKLSYTIPSRTPEYAARGKSRTPFEHPYSLAVNPLTGDIIVGDDYKQIVTAVSPSQDNQSTRILWRYCPGPGDRHFFPSSICADSKGYIFIADLYNEKVYMLDSSGKFVKTLLSRGDGLKGGPGAIAADGRGHLLVADEEKTIKIFKYRDENGFAVNKRYSYCPQAT